jgi:hypothetical protein
MDNPEMLYLYLALGCIALFCAVLTAATLADKSRERKSHLPGGGNRRRPDAP